ncbi:Os01g0968601, partial [Oryza sativa Japonica Group]
MSLIHCSDCTVPRHATKMLRRPSAAFPSSVATATYPIQLLSLHLRKRETDCRMNGSGTATHDLAYRRIPSRRRSRTARPRAPRTPRRRRAAAPLSRPVRRWSRTPASPLPMPPMPRRQRMGSRQRWRTGRRRRAAGDDDDAAAAHLAERAAGSGAG